MKKTIFPILLVAGFAFSAPLRAETDLGEIVSGIAQSLISQEADRAAYVNAQNLNTANAYRTYLEKFPKGAYRENAKQSLKKLGAAVDPVTPPPIGGANASAATVEASIGLSRSQRILIQKQLSSIGYPTGVADGLWGANTRQAISRWQTANKVPASGYVTAQQVNLIARQAGPEVSTPSNGAVVSDDPIEERLLDLTYAERREVQRRLSSLGYNTRGVDGSFGTNTRRALAAWQRDEGLRSSGYLTADQLRALRRDTGG